MPLGLGDHALPVVLAGGIGLHEARVLAELARQRLAFGLAPAGEDHLGALRDEQLGRARADAAGRTGDDAYLAVEHAHGVSSQGVRPLASNVCVCSAL